MAAPASNSALPPAAAVLMVSVCSAQKRHSMSARCASAPVTSGRIAPSRSASARATCRARPAAARDDAHAGQCGLAEHAAGGRRGEQLDRVAPARPPPRTPRAAPARGRIDQATLLPASSAAADRGGRVPLSGPLRQHREHAAGDAAAGDCSRRSDRAARDRPGGPAPDRRGHAAGWPRQPSAAAPPAARPRPVRATPAPTMFEIRLAGRSTRPRRTRRPMRKQERPSDTPDGSAAKRRR